MAQDGTQGGDRDHKPLRTEMSRAVRFGLTGGVNIAKFATENISPSPSITAKTSMYGGGFVNIPLGKAFAIQPGIQWTGFGSKLREGNVSSEQDLHYLGVPIALQFMPGNNGFFLEAGGQANFLLTAREENSITNTRTGNKDAFDKFEVGAFGGVGYLTRIGLGFTAKYYYGLANVLEDGGGNNSSNDGPELKNRAYQFGLVYHFGAAK
ncbi:hypothetical protein GCM10023184_22860 [Flaviaesturariibacter amylovorans]|uniref:Outer membrane protein beta-barrel domain-containing protein n=2 Tax=Flaviaesturariibacter amylovorans TaxID=1084520 RepID=A0ABP8GX56_9BACT